MAVRGLRHGFAVGLVFCSRVRENDGWRYATERWLVGVEEAHDVRQHDVKDEAAGWMMRKGRGG